MTFTLATIPLAEVQRRTIDILVYVDQLCREHNLKYTIYYGTLIGLERHQGFIPWDDDIDIVMRRPDYERLLAILEKETRYQLLSMNNRPHFRYPFTKLVDKQTRLVTKQIFAPEDPLMGVFLDIFPLDGIPATDAERLAYYHETEQDRLNMMDTIAPGSYARSFTPWKAWVKRITGFSRYRKVKAIGDDDYWRDQYQKAALRCPINESQYCGYLEWISHDWGVFPTRWFDDDQYEDVQFAGHTIMAIKHRVDFLHLRFGDYMQMPPESERVTHHPYEFYLK